MKKLLISVSLALMLVSIMAIPAMAAEQSVGASVEVNEVISATITDNGDTGLIFGSMSQSETDKAEAAQNGVGAVTIVVAAETNVNCDIEVKATDFTGTGSTLAITNAKYGTTNVVGSATAAWAGLPPVRVGVARGTKTPAKKFWPKGLVASKSLLYSGLQMLILSVSVAWGPGVGRLGHGVNGPERCLSATRLEMPSARCCTNRRRLSLDCDVPNAAESCF